MISRDDAARMWDRVELHLSRARNVWPPEDSRPTRETLAALKAAARASGDDAEAKRAWCFETMLDMQSGFALAFQQLRDGQYYKAWCTLEQVELSHHFLLRHVPDRAEFAIDYIAATTAELQRLFPYRLFFSPEILELEKRCSICDAIVSIRRGCGHEVGEIYGGEMCCRKVTKVQLLGISAVEKPVQKYSVAFTVDSATGARKDQYDYSLIGFLAQRLQSPYHAWSAQEERRRHPHRLFAHIGKYDPCPCESGEKYKFCCLKHEGGVLRPHWQFMFSVEPPSHLCNFEYTGYGPPRTRRSD